MKILKSISLAGIFLSVINLSAASAVDHRITDQEVREFVRSTIMERWPELQEDRAIRLENSWAEVVKGINPEKQQREFVQDQIRYYFLALGGRLHQEYGLVIIESIESERAEHIEALNTYPGKQVVDEFINMMIHKSDYISDVLIKTVSKANNIAIEVSCNDVRRLWHDVLNAEWWCMIGKGFGSDEIEARENQYAYIRLQSIIMQLLERSKADMEIYANTAYRDAIGYSQLSSKSLPWEQHKQLIDTAASKLAGSPLMLSRFSRIENRLFSLIASMVEFGEQGDARHRAVIEFMRETDELQKQYAEYPEKYVVFCKAGSGPFRLEKEGWRIVNAKGEWVDENFLGASAVHVPRLIREVKRSDESDRNK